MTGVRVTFLLTSFLFACGDDPPASPPTPAPRVARPAPKTKQLRTVMRIEDRVHCPSDGPCPERAAIRHVFVAGDFGAGGRDPFAKVEAVPPVAVGGGRDAKCPETVADALNYQQLKLVGIVSQGAQRKALLTNGSDNYILAKGDCAGRERVLVSDIGASFVTFQGGTGEYSMQLHDKLH